MPRARTRNVRTHAERFVIHEMIETNRNRSVSFDRGFRANFRTNLNPAKGCVPQCVPSLYVPTLWIRGSALDMSASLYFGLCFGPERWGQPDRIHHQDCQRIGPVVRRQEMRVRSHPKAVSSSLHRFFNSPSPAMIWGCIQSIHSRKIYLGLGCLRLDPRY